jgi:ABC-type nitrate/sulfonate/bicarbonate transport system substrate-binding protein
LRIADGRRGRMEQEASVLSHKYATGGSHIRHSRESGNLRFLLYFPGFRLSRAGCPLGRNNVSTVFVAVSLERRSKMAKVVLMLVSVLTIALGPTTAPAQLRKVRLAIPTLDIITLPLKMAQAKGFYQKEGLDPEIILIAGALGVKALLGNSVEFSTASGSVLAAAVRGVPVKLVLVIASKPTFDLISEPKIQSFAQLKGKPVGISTRGGTFDHVTRLILERNGLNPDKDVAILALGRQDDLHLALKAGRISAAIFSPPRNLMLYRDGFQKLAFTRSADSASPMR